MTLETNDTAKRVRIGLLLDAYGDLLTDKQQNFMRLYYEQDLSFGEIAAEAGVSRQAVFDAVRHGEATVEEYEAKLGLAAGGWAAWSQAGWTAERVVKELEKVAGLIEAKPAAAKKAIGKIVTELKSAGASEE